MIYDYISFGLLKLYTHGSSPVHTNNYACHYQWCERVGNNLVGDKKD